MTWPAKYEDFGGIKNNPKILTVLSEVGYQRQILDMFRLGRRKEK